MGKKTFRDNLLKESSPASKFITEPAESSEYDDNQTANEQPVKETKSVRVNLLFKPSIKSDMDKLAVMNRSSLNNLMNDIAAEYIRAHRDDLDRYDNTFD